VLLLFTAGKSVLVYITVRNPWCCLPVESTFLHCLHHRSCYGKTRRHPENWKYINILQYSWRRTKPLTQAACTECGKVCTQLLVLLLLPFYGQLDCVRGYRVSRYQKGKTSLDLLEQELVAVVSAGHMQICIWPLTDNHASIPPLSFFTGRMPFLPPADSQTPSHTCTQAFSSQCCALHEG